MTNVAVAEKKQKEVAQTTNQEKEVAVEARPIARRRVVVPTYEVFTNKTGYEINAQLPGVPSENLSIELEGLNLTVKGRADIPNLDGFKPLHMEFTAADYQATFKIPASVDSDAIEAGLEQGVLTLRLPLVKKERKAIQIKAS